jgi:hypothetical protein
MGDRIGNRLRIPSELATCHVEMPGNQRSLTDEHDAIGCEILARCIGRGQAFWLASI